MAFKYSVGLFLDLYELTMAQVYFEKELFGKAVFSLFIRNRPKNRPFFLFAGLDPFLKLLKNFKFKEKDLEYLESLKIFKKNFLIILKIFLLKVQLDVFLRALYFLKENLFVKLKVI